MVKCGSPRRYGLVPSSGSTRKKLLPTVGACPAAAASSDTAGTPGAMRASAARMIASDSRSATVTGLPSALTIAVTPAARCAICTRAAASVTGRRLSARK